MIFLIVLIALVFAIPLIRIIYLLITAPVGYEDGRGYHDRLPRTTPLKLDEIT